MIIQWILLERWKGVVGQLVATDQENPSHLHLLVIIAADAVVTGFDKIRKWTFLDFFTCKKLIMVYFI